MPKYKYLTGEPRSEIVVGFRLTQAEVDKLEAFCKKNGIKKARLLKDVIEMLAV